jgi:hypothetical protein
MELVRFYSTVIWIGIALGLSGELKSCTLQMMNLAADKTQHGIVSYERFSKLLTK